MGKIVMALWGTFFLVQAQAGAAVVTSDVEQIQQAEKAKQKAGRIEEKTVEQGRPVSPPPGGTISKPEAQAVDPAGKEPMEDVIVCLARTIYWEARNEGDAGQQAIANVVVNRLAHEGFPKTICGVVKEGQEKKACQFSWWCDGLADTAQDETAYTRAKEIARKVLNRQLGDLTGGALYFHHRGNKPPWAGEYIRTVEVGDHIFYKPGGGKAK